MAKKQKKNNKNFIERIKRKIEPPMLIALGIVVALLIISFVAFGKELTILLFIGIVLILGIARLLDKIKSNKKRKKILNIVLIFFLIIAILMCLAVAAFCIMIVKVSPDFDISKLSKKESSIIYDANGEEFARFGDQLRENVSYDDLPEVFIDALIATEDSRYFQHNGFDAPRFIKASMGQALGKDAGGASTLSMQLIKNTYTEGLKRTKGIDGIIRKFEDIYLAVFKLEKNYSKEEIIEYYVNNYELGNNAWGVEQASQTIFSKSVTDLNLSEAALLVGIFNNPTKYNPLLHPQASSNRRNTVLRLMVHHGYITQEEADIASNIPVESLLNPSSNNSQYGAYIKAVYDELKDKYGINPNTTSVLVYTNMDRNKQEGMDKIMNGESFSWQNSKVQGAAAIVDVKNGHIVALGGGRNKSTLGLNIATQGKKQIGSTAKPIFDYGPAIEYLNWSTYQQIVDEPWQYSTGQVIGNSDGQFMGQISMRTALAQSRNIPALKAFQAVASEAGNNKIYEFATNLGIKPQTASNGTIYESHALGAFDGTTPLMMAAAYAAFSNGGTYYEPTTINKIVYRNNNEVKTIKVEGKKAMSEATAYMITSMLETAVQDGLSSGARMNGVHIAAKTGTTNFDQTVRDRCNIKDGVNDAWLVGYDPEYSVAMWYGYEDMSECNYNSSVQAVVQRGKLFQAIGNVIFTRDNKEFSVPSTVSRVCVEKGHMEATLPSEYTPQDQLVCEYFKKGHEPTTVSTAYNKLDSVKNLKVTYDEKKMKINITWDKVSTPNDAEESYGAFGYKVYYGDVLLGFVTTNSYSITANTNISGTYKVVTTYENYTNNQSNPASYKFEYTPAATPETTPSTSPTTSPSPSATTKQ